MEHPQEPIPEVEFDHDMGPFMTKMYLTEKGKVEKSNLVEESRMIRKQRILQDNTSTNYVIDQKASIEKDVLYADYGEGGVTHGLISGTIDTSEKLIDCLEILESFGMRTYPSTIKNVYIVNLKACKEYLDVIVDYMNSSKRYTIVKCSGDMGNDVFEMFLKYEGIKSPLDNARAIIKKEDTTDLKFYKTFLTAKEMKLFKSGEVITLNSKRISEISKKVHPWTNGNTVETIKG